MKRLIFIFVLALTGCEQQPQYVYQPPRNISVNVGPQPYYYPRPIVQPMYPVPYYTPRPYCPDGRCPPQHPHR